MNKWPPCQDNDVEYPLRVCDACGNGSVQNEPHVIFDCILTEQLRLEFEDIFQNVENGDEPIIHSSAMQRQG